MRGRTCLGIPALLGPGVQGEGEGGVDAQVLLLLIKLQYYIGGGGGGSLVTLKSDYVIYARPLTATRRYMSMNTAPVRDSSS